LKSFLIFPKGVSYTFEKEKGTCDTNPIGKDFFTDSFALATGLGFDIRLKSPDEFFHLDKDYFYLGKVFLSGQSIY
jgi:hypothetical protein